MDLGGLKVVMCFRWGNWTAVTSILNVLGCARVTVALKDVASILESRSCRELCTVQLEYRFLAWLLN